MNGGPSSPPTAMVVAGSDAERGRCCRELARHGYAAVGFADCANATAWLEEETPAVAIVARETTGACESLLAVLAERDVPLTMGRPSRQQSRAGR